MLWLTPHKPLLSSPLPCILPPALLQADLRGGIKPDLLLFMLLFPLPLLYAVLVFSVAHNRSDADGVHRATILTVPITPAAVGRHVQCGARHRVGADDVCGAKGGLKLQAVGAQSGCVSILPPWAGHGCKVSCSCSASVRHQVQLQALLAPVVGISS